MCSAYAGRNVVAWRSGLRLWNDTRSGLCRVANRIGFAPAPVLPIERLLKLSSVNPQRLLALCFSLRNGRYPRVDILVMMSCRMSSYGDEVQLMTSKKKTLNSER